MHIAATSSDSSSTGTCCEQMNKFGLPLVPSALALWAINLIDRLFINGYKGQSEVGIYSLANRIASVRSSSC